MEALQKKIQKLQQQQNKIADEINVLLKQRNEELMNVLSHLPAGAPHPHVLIGGLLHVIEEAAKNPAKREEWLKAGGKFQRRYPIHKAHPNLNKAGRQNAED